MAAAEAIPLPAEADAPVRALGEVDIMSPEIRAARNEETIPTELVLGVRETYALSLKGKGIQYASSDKKVATVKKTGVVRAVARGLDGNLVRDVRSLLERRRRRLPAASVTVFSSCDLGVCRCQDTDDELANNYLGGMGPGRLGPN